MPVITSAVQCKSSVLEHCKIQVEEVITLYGLSRTCRDEISVLNLINGMIK
jgi:hypothetical protein